MFGRKMVSSAVDLCDVFICERLKVHFPGPGTAGGSSMNLLVLPIFPHPELRCFELKYCPVRLRDSAWLYYPGPSFWISPSIRSDAEKEDPRIWNGLYRRRPDADWLHSTLVQDFSGNSGPTHQWSLVCRRDRTCTRLSVSFPKRSFLDAFHSSWEEGYPA